ncbi:MAG TPA: class I SAM-dependent methyltransferase [Rhodospirillaceae bacterium]|nr:class I SAM-dependent methyltransferase [Rhodospirillaceae bacterium]
MVEKYDEIIIGHYDRVAKEYGISSASTMSDETVRRRETEIIFSFVERMGRLSREGSALKGGCPERFNGDKVVRIIDVGCGNGYTLKALAERFSAYSYTGVEYNDAMRSLAEKQIAGLPHVEVKGGDIRRRESLDIPNGLADIVICQRVLINILSADDSRCALDNVVSLVRAGGFLLFFECFSSALENLNSARAEFGLDAIGPAHHNRYLEDDFFVRPELLPCDGVDDIAERHVFSTHFFVTRVLHAAMQKYAGDVEFKRNSHFVQFLTKALPEAVGSYAPLQCLAYVKKPPA